MHFIRDAISDARLKYKISNNVHGAVHFFRRVQYNHNPATRSSLSASTAQETTEEDSIADSVQSNSGKNYPATCLALAEEHSKLVLQNVCEHLSFSHNDSAYATLLLLEYMVSSGSRAFHVSVARNSGVKEKLVMLASRRAESPGQRRVQHLARLTLLDYRRVFADDEDLRPLAVLADQFERKTHKNLMRCLNVRQTHVRFRDPEEGDFIALSSRELDPKGEDGQSEEHDGDSSEVKPPPIKRNYPPWTCRVCSHVNPPAALHCRSCSSARRGSSPPISPPAGGRHDGMFGVGSADVDVDEGAPPPVEAGDEGQQSPNTHLSGSSSLGEVQPTGSAKMEKCMSGSVDSSRAVVSELSSSAEQHASIISSTSTVKMELSHGSIAARGLEAERNEVPAFTEVEEAQTTSQRANSDHTHSLAMETQDT